METGSELLRLEDIAKLRGPHLHTWHSEFPGIGVVTDKGGEILG